MERISIGSSADLPEGGALRFRTRLHGEAVDAFVVRREGRPYAYVNRCTHRHVPLDLGSGSFFLPDGERLLCRAHGAIFEVRTGACSGGVCPKGSALTALPVVEEAGSLYVLAQ